MKKVYCKNCKFYWNANSNYLINVRNPHKCNEKHNLQKKDTAIEPITVYKSYADEINKNNNCLYYHKKWYNFWVK